MKRGTLFLRPEEKIFNFVELAIQFMFFDKGFITSVNLMLCNAGLIQVDENLSLFTIKLRSIYSLCKNF